MTKRRLANLFIALTITASVALFITRDGDRGTPLAVAINTVFEMGPTGAVVAWDRREGDIALETFGTLTDVAEAGALRFRMASLTKPVASAAILELVAQGELSLDDHVTQLLPDLSFVDTRAEEMTLRDLLRHSAGFDETEIAPLFAEPDRLAQDLGLDAGSITDCSPIAEAMAARPLGYAPGEQYLYSNTGYCLIELILRSRMDGGLLAAFRTLVPETAGLSLDAANIDVDGPIEASLSDWLVHDPKIVGAAGGLIGSVDAYMTFLSRPIAEIVSERPNYATDETQYYGLGWRIWPEPTCPARTHFGSMPSAYSVAVVNEDGRRFVALFEGRPQLDGPAFAAILSAACATFAATD